MKIKPNKFYKEESARNIYYMYTDNEIVYDVIYIYKETNKVTKYDGRAIFYLSIDAFNAMFCNNDLKTNIIEISESDFLLETL